MPDLVDAWDALELQTRFDGLFAPYQHVLLAVSGGADSVAMMQLVARWAQTRRRAVPRVSVATVDHQLRPHAADEAIAVARLADALGLPHRTLLWTGDKPATGLQAAARAARVALLRAHAQAIGADAVALAHTRDDQAETVLMRLARGSGVDGLGGMAPISDLDGLTLVRPLLDVPKSALMAMLTAQAITWSEDPSNQQEAFERVRWRQAATHLADLGLTSVPLSRSARRLRRARSALDAMTERIVFPPVDVTPHQTIGFDHLGFARLSWSGLLTEPEDLRLRVLLRLIALVGGSSAPISLSRLEAITEGQQWSQPIGRTLGRVMLMASTTEPDDVLLVREPGQGPAPTLRITPGTSELFDGRCQVTMSAACAHAAVVQPLGSAGLAHLTTLMPERPSAPRAALSALPSLWIGESLAAVPHLNYFTHWIGHDAIVARWTWQEPSDVTPPDGHRQA
jgi:tRNA(Ile)-lysidine synthase